MKLKNLFLAIVALSLAACAFDKDKGLTDGDEIKRRELLKQSYQKVEGTYNGTIKTVNGLEDIQLVLTVLDEEAGDNSHKLPVMNPLLAAYYKKINPVGPGYEFTTRLYPDKNEIVLVNKAEKLTRDDIHTINAKIENGVIVGRASSTGGFIGNIELSLTSRQTGGGGTTEENEYYDNLYRQYLETAGTYVGQLVSTTEAPLDVTLDVKVFRQTPAGGSIAIPVILSTLKFNKDPWGISDFKFVATYNMNVTPRRLTLIGKSTYAGSIGQLDLEGVLVGDEFRGEFLRQPKMSSGTFILKRQPTPVAP